MTVKTWLHYSQQELETSGIETARLDSLILLEACSDQDRGYLLAHPELVLKPDIIDRLNILLKRRALHEPMSYIRGKSEFYGREFKIGPGVMTPRPESEMLIDFFKSVVAQPPPANNDRGTNHNWKVADVGTGSGALGITAALEAKNAAVDLLDIDDDALRIAKSNVINFATGTIVVQSDLLNAAPTNYDILLCNLPYVPDSYGINRSAAYEPSIALFGGPDGLDLYRRLFGQIRKLSKQPLYILTEAFPEGHSVLKDIAADSGYKELKSADYIQLFVFNK